MVFLYLRTSLNPSCSIQSSHQQRVQFPKRLQLAQSILLIWPHVYPMIFSWYGWNKSVSIEKTRSNYQSDICLGDERTGKVSGSFLHVNAICTYSFFLYLILWSYRIFYLSWWISYIISSELGITFDPNLQLGTNNFSKSICKVGEYCLIDSFSFIKWPGDTINWKISAMSRSEGLLLPHITWGGIFWDHRCCSLLLRAPARPHI